MEYRNLRTGEVTKDKAIARSWWEDGDDYAIWHWSNVFGEMVELAETEH